MFGRRIAEPKDDLPVDHPTPSSGASGSRPEVAPPIEVPVQAEKPQEDDDEASKRSEEKFSFPKFLEKWKLPEALPLNLLVKRFIKEFTSKTMTAAKQSQAVQEFLGVSFIHFPSLSFWFFLLRSPDRRAEG